MYMESQGALFWHHTLILELVGVVVRMVFVDVMYGRRREIFVCLNVFERLLLWSS